MGDAMLVDQEAGPSPPTVEDQAEGQAEVQTAGTSIIGNELAMEATGAMAAKEATAGQIAPLLKGSDRTDSTNSAILTPSSSVNSGLSSGSGKKAKGKAKSPANSAAQTSPLPGTEAAAAPAATSTTTEKKLGRRARRKAKAAAAAAATAAAAEEVSRVAAELTAMTANATATDAMTTIPAGASAVAAAAARVAEAAAALFAKQAATEAKEATATTQTATTPPAAAAEATASAFSFAPIPDAGSFKPPLNPAAAPFPVPASRQRSVVLKPKPKSKSKRERSGGSRDPILTPSAASGGVPDPTPSYLQRALRPPAPPSPKPNPLLLVIDLNGTLLHRPNRRGNPKNFVARPHAARFLAYCVETFWTVIWSSARPQNVAAMCAALLGPDQLRRVVAVWGRERLGLAPDDYGRRVQVYKRLTTVWEDPVVAASHPDFVENKGGDKNEADGTTNGAPPLITSPTLWGQHNTVLIDDSPEKARSEPYNLICLPEFDGDPRGEREQPAVLPQVHDYINELCFQPDVSAAIRARPFRLQ